jgi:hypothetical protein
MGEEEVEEAPRPSLWRQSIEMKHAHDLAEKIIAESRKEEGTWSYAFLMANRLEVRKLKPEELQSMMSELIAYLRTGPPVLSAFKTCQFLSHLRHQELNGSQGFFRMAEAELLEVIKFYERLMEVDSLASVIVDLVKGFFRDLEVKPNRIQRGAQCRSTPPSQQGANAGRERLMPSVSSNISGGTAALSE